MRRNWTCSKCKLVFSRKWNLERHVKLMHGVNEQLKGFPHPFGQLTNKQPVSNDDALNVPLFGLKENFKEVFDFVEMQNKMANSSLFLNQSASLHWQVNSLQQQVASYQGQINSLQQQVASYQDQINSLQQQVGLYEKMLNVLLSLHWQMPKISIQGFSGYLCDKCKSFSLKPIFDLGYDMTMEWKHQCNMQGNYLVFKIPSDIRKIHQWAGKLLSDHVASNTNFGKHLFARELTKAPNNLQEERVTENINTFLEGPDRFSLYRVNNNDYPSWIDRAIRNLGTKIEISESEKIDFLTRIKSTYAIFEVQTEQAIRRIYVTLTS